VNFDHPRDSPFARNHSLAPSARSSISVSTTTTDIPPRAFPKPPTSAMGGESLLGVGPVDPDRLSVATARSRGRSASEASMNSGFGDFYDAYYRSSILAGRASRTASRGSSMDTGRNGSVDASEMAGNTGVMDRLPRGRPAPLKLGGSNLGEVMEVASPMGSPALMPGSERFPSQF
jgi:hypothetical protein